MQPRVVIHYRESASRDPRGPSPPEVPFCVVGDRNSDPELMAWLGARQRSKEAVYEVAGRPDAIIEKLESKGYNLVSRKVDTVRLYGSDAKVFTWTLTFPGTVLVTDL